MKLHEYMGYLESHEPKEVYGVQYCLQLYFLARAVKAKAILELGLGWGHSAHAFGAAMGSMAGGVLTSVDMSDSLPTPDQFMTSWNVQWNRSISNIKDYKHDGLVDLLYIDEDAAATAIDFHRFYDNVRSGGLIVMDGIGNPPFDKTPIAGEQVRGLINSGFCIVAIPYHDEYCHAIYRKGE